MLINPSGMIAIVFDAHHAAHSFEPYTDADFDACMGLYERWADDRAKANSDDVYRSMLQENRLVHARLLKFWKALGLIVRVLKVEGRSSAIPLVLLWMKIRFVFTRKSRI